MLVVEKEQNLYSRENFANLAKNTLAKMWQYAKNGLFFDVILIAAEDGKKISAHRSVLCAMNEFFHSMFSSKFKEADDKEVTISEISGDILEALIQYCYTGTIHINEDNVQLILPQASLMLFPEIVDACSHFLISKINPGNCLSIVKFAKLYNCQELLESVQEHMKEQFLNVSVTDQFLKLRQEELEEYLSFDELNVDSEKEVFESMMKWINHNLETRSSALSKLLPLIRLENIEYKFLLEYVVNNYQNEHYFSIFEAIKQNLLHSPQAVPARKGPKSNRIIIICTKKIHIYNIKSNVIEFIYDISDCGRFKPTLHKEKVILVAKDQESKYFDLNTKTWHDFASMSTERMWSGVEVLNEFVYVFGGALNFGSINTVERWDSKVNKWNYVASMNHTRYNPCTALVNGKLYVIGGYENFAKLNLTVECYDPIKDSWSVCSMMPTARYYTRAVVSNGEIFLFGGKSDRETLNCIEKYNPGTNTWTEVSQMIHRRHSMGAYLLNEKIYLFGGHNGREWLKSMEEFDPITNKCKLIDNLNIEYKEDLYCFPYSSKYNY